MDFVLNGRAQGSVASKLLANNFDANCLRPYIGADGRSYITQNQGDKNVAVVTNADATLRKNDWIMLDTAIIKAAKPRMSAWAALRAANSYTIPNGMAKTTLEHQTQGDITPASISMDGLKRSENDRPVFDLTTMPLPIIHKDFSFSARQIAASRSGGSPLDTTSAELAARRVGEEVEKLTVGVADTYSFGGGSIYGYANYPNRLTKVMTAPSSSNHATTVAEVLAMKTQSQDAYHYGPWMLYNSTSWDASMDEDYSTAKGDITLRERLKKINGIVDVQTLDYLPAKTLMLVQMTSDVARAVVGMDIMTVQWESEGGLQLNFKVMCILVPQLRCDYNSNTGIVHGTHP